jgi:hypothetical protein
MWMGPRHSLENDLDPRRLFEKYSVCQQYHLQQYWLSPTRSNVQYEQPLSASTRLSDNQDSKYYHSREYGSWNGLSCDVSLFREDCLRGYDCETKCDWFGSFHGLVLRVCGSIRRVRQLSTWPGRLYVSLHEPNYSLVRK